MKKYILMMLLFFLLVTKVKAGYFVFINESVSWTEARSICQSAGGDTLLDSREEINNTCTRQYLQKPARYWMGFYSILTPYISHHGCFQIINPLDADHNTTIAMIIPSVGTCFDHCQNYRRFGIMNDICICLDLPETGIMIHKVNRSSCNISCNLFQENEYCGGLNGHLNLYHISMITENGPSDNRCLYLDCPDAIGEYHQVECTKGLLGRVCENSIMHQDNVTYQEARSKCGQSYLDFEHACDSNKIQANVKYWVDVKRYQIPKQVTGHHESHDFHADIPDLFSCLFYDTSKDQVLFGNCSMLNYAIYETETVSSDEYPYCPKDQNEANEFQSTTEQGNLESHSYEIAITKVTDCTYCSSNNGGAASATLEYTESSQIRTRNKELDTETIWGPILGIVIVIGCVVGGVVFYRYRSRASEAKQYEKSQKYDTEDPNRNYFVLEAQTSQSNAGGTAKTNYDNVNAQCATEKESVYAEQPDTVYDHLGKHRQLKLAQDRVPDDIYADGSTNAAADIGDYNTLNDTYRQRQALSIIQDGDGYGHLDNVVSNRNIDSDYDHC